MATRVSSFVGRERELEALERLLAQTAAGEGAIALLLGEPGVGKTRTAEELAAAARSRAMAVTWGACFEDEPSPFAPWVEIGSQIVRETAANHLGVRLGTAASALADVIPDVAAALPEVPRPALLGAEESRHRLHDALARLLVAGDTSRLVVADDLHWAGLPSLELLRHLARLIGDSRTLLLGTAREAQIGFDHPLAQVLGDVERRVPVHRVRLSALDQAATSRLVEAVAGRRPSPGALETITQETGGNPFFTTELVRHLEEQGLDVAASSLPPAAIPASVRDAVSRRVARLSAETARMLSVACAFSAPFELPELRVLADVEEIAALDALDEALSASLLRPLGGDRYEFAHAIVRQTLYEALSPSRQSRLHRRVAQTIEQVHRGDERYAGELAVQYDRSRSLPGAAHGLPHALAAADWAERRHSPAHVRTFLMIARDLAVESDAAARADILARLAIAQAETLDVEASLRTVEEVLTTLVEASSEGETVAAFISKALWGLQDAGAAQELLEPLLGRGLAAIGERRNLTWARLKLAERPLERIEAGPVNAGRWLGFDREAVALAREQGGERDYARTLEVMDWRPHDEVDRLQATIETWEDASARIHGLSVVARSLMIQHGAVRVGLRVAERLLEVAEAAGSVPGQAYAHDYVAQARVARGEFEAAREHDEAASDLIRRLGAGHRLHRSLTAWDEWSPGRLEPDWRAMGDRYRAQSLDPTNPPWMGLVHAAVAAERYARAGAEADARTLLGLIVPALVSTEPTALNLNGAVASAAAAIWLLDTDEFAEPLFDAAQRVREAGVGYHARVASTSLDLAIAHAAALLGRNDEAEAAFERARAVAEAEELAPLRALVDHDEALFRHRSGLPGALPLVESAEARFAELGIPYRLQRARSLREQIAERLPGGLTRREAEILRLLASGSSNKEIAATLVVSVHTVERHVANVYRKIGTRNRAEATAYAARAGIT
jgi:DNA-binding CsgD family transcriptional regulator